MTSKFKKLPASTEEIETEWCLLRTAVITSAIKCCGRKRVGETKSSEKRTPWWNHEVKEGICAKKVTWLEIGYQLNFVCSTLKHVCRQPQKLNYLQKRPQRNLEKVWTMISKWQTKYSSRPLAVSFIEDLKKDLEPQRFLHRRFKWSLPERSSCYFDLVKRIL